MQAALMIRSKQRIARNKLRRQRLGIKGELPTSVATKDIPPYPRFPPESWVGIEFLSVQYSVLSLSRTHMKLFLVKPD